MGALPTSPRSLTPSERPAHQRPPTRFEKQPAGSSHRYRCPYLRPLHFLSSLTALFLPLQVSVAFGQLGIITSRTLLWDTVHHFCVPRAATSTRPLPCSRVDLQRGEDLGFATLTNPLSPNDILIVPTAKISGIEDPRLLGDALPNYWDDAWRQRDLLESRLGFAVSRDRVGMALNSALGRSQDQFHIHLGCVYADVRRTLLQNEQRISASTWTPVRFGATGHEYLARRVIGSDLGGIFPFKLLASEVPRAKRDMASQTLVVVGASFVDGSPGYYLLNHQANPAEYDWASGAELLDTNCLSAR